MRIFGLTILLALAPLTCSPMQVLAAPPEGYPATVDITFSGTASYNGPYSFAWSDDDEAFILNTSYEPLGGSLGIDGTGTINDLGGGDDLINFAGTWAGGSYGMNLIAQAGGGFTGASLPEATSVIGLFFLTHLACCRKSRLGYSRQQSQSSSSPSPLH